MYRPRKEIIVANIRGEHIEVPVVRDLSTGGFSVVIVSNLSSKEFFFAESHSKFDEERKIEGNDWVPSTFYLPHTVVKRPGLEDGVIDSIEKLVFIYERGSKLI